MKDIIRKRIIESAEIKKNLANDLDFISNIEK